MQPWFYFSFMEAKNFAGEDDGSTVTNEQYIEAVIRDILEAGVREGIFAVRDCRLSAAAIKAILQDWYLSRWKFARDNITIDEYARFVIDLTASLCPPPGA